MWSFLFCIKDIVFCVWYCFSFILWWRQLSIDNIHFSQIIDNKNLPKFEIITHCCNFDLDQVTKSIEIISLSPNSLLFIGNRPWTKNQLFLFLCPTYDSRGALCFLVCGSVRSFVCLFVCLSRFKLKLLVKVVFEEVKVQSTWNLVHMFPMIWSGGQEDFENK